MICADQVHCKTGSCLYEEMVDRVRIILEKCIDNFQVKLKNYEEDSGKLHAEMIKNLKRKMKELEEKELSQWEAQSHPDPAQRMPPEIFKRLSEKLRKEKDNGLKAGANWSNPPFEIDVELKV